MNVNQRDNVRTRRHGNENISEFYSGDDEEYITFSYLDERPGFWADDEPIYDGTYVRVSLWTRNNPQKYKSKSENGSAAGLYGHVDCGVVR